MMKRYFKFLTLVPLTYFLNLLLAFPAKEEEVFPNICLPHVVVQFCVPIFSGYAYEELSEVSPSHQFLAYTMYDKDNDFFRLSVRNLNSGSLCSKPQAERVSGLAWAKDGKALLYVVTDQNKRPCRYVLHVTACFIS